LKNIAVLLDGGIYSDGRVQRIIKSLSLNYNVFLYYCQPSENDRLIFNSKNVFLNPYKIKNRNWLTRNFFFNNKFNDLVNSVKSSKIKFSLIYVNDYPLLKSGVILKKITGSKLIYDSHEIYIETINQFFPTRGLKGKLFGAPMIVLNKIYHSYCEKKYVKNIDLFITVCDSFSKYFQSHFKISQVNVLKNCPQNTEPTIKTNLIRKKLGLKNHDKIILYQGVLNPGRGLKMIIDSSQYLEENINFVIIGDGPQKKELLQYFEDTFERKNVFFMEKVSFSSLIKYTTSADLGILLIESFNLSKKLTLPNKVFEYMNAGIPFITNQLPEASKIAKDEDCGYVINDSTPEKIGKQINQIVKNIDFEKGKKGRRAIEEKYYWELDFRKIEKKLTNLL
jgi:glycosyltransferase involved in cell wall biosynthesis